MSTSSSSSLGKNLLVSGMLLLGVYAVFGQTTHYQFVRFDDNDYVYENPFVARGLTFRGVWWAFAHTQASNWHPLTWVSHMLDCQYFGLDAGWHHATNFVLHGISACLLLVLLRRLSNAFWASAFVAAMFAIHPLRVESVAWVAERKDILGGLFFFLTLLAYESYIRRGQPLGRYVLTTFLFILGLMAKPMLVTLPVVALLLDYWPLGRFRKLPSPSGRGGPEPADDEPGEDESQSCLPPIVPLLMEKMPWLVLSAASCAITIVAQKKAIMPFDQLPLALRLPNAVISYAEYLKLAVWPQKLAVFYPSLGRLAPWPVLIGAMVLLAGISFAVVLLRRKCPYLLVGWLWYLGMLVPVIGLMQVGSQAMADRYTYLPLIGIYISLAWMARSLVLRWPPIRTAVATVATLILSLSLVAAWQQTTFWRDDLTLWLRTTACTPENSKSLNNLAVALAGAGQWEEAQAMIDRVIEIQPDCGLSYCNRGWLLARDGKNTEAIEQLKKAVELEPNSLSTQNELARLLALVHRKRESIDCLEGVLKIDPNAIVVQENLAWVLATTASDEGGDPQRAVALAEHVCRVIPSPDDNDWDLLAAAYAADGRFADALTVADRALKIAVIRGKDKVAAEIRARIKLYEAKKPYRT